MNKRLDGMNEFRQTLSEQSDTFLTKAEYSVFRSRVEEDIRMLREAKSMLEGKASQQALNVTMIISIVGLIVGMLSILLRLIGI